MINEQNFNLQTIYGDPVKWTGHFNVTYKGVPSLKCPFDYTLYQMLIMDIEPDLIIEIGTYKGGGALYYADLLYLLGGNRRVHTINITDEIESIKVRNHPQIDFFTDGFENYDLGLANKYNRVLVIDDGSHQYRDVMKSLEIFSDVVTENSYFIVEDSIMTQMGFDNSAGGGPTKAIKDFLEKDSRYVIDRQYCDFFGLNATFNPNGYLKKVRK
jgi:cephalosporin hydroxylase